MLALFSWVVLTSAEPLKVDFTSTTTFNHSVIERRDLYHPLINDLMHQVSYSLLEFSLISLFIS
jgi:hypothetical protein